LSRHVDDTSLVCHAPSNSMYFNVHGEVGPCWLNLTEMGKYPENTISEIWFGEQFSKLRKAVKSEDLAYRCGTCMHNMKQGNHVSVLAKLYDYPYPIKEYPTVMEFELSNKCNLECVMCKGELSSTIRKNREKLPPLANPYDSRFVDQLEAFIPHLEEAKFLGGEPFLIDLYYDIWERIAEIKPDIKITITTNATVFNNRVSALLDKLNCSIIVSIDSFEKESYLEIRKRANFETVMTNFDSYLHYTKTKNTYMQVSMNPLRLNWQEMAASIEFVNDRNVALWFNTVVYPHDQAIWTLGAKKLEHIYHTLSEISIASKPKSCSRFTYDNNVRNYSNLVNNQIKNWWIKAKEEEEKRSAESMNMSSQELGAKIKETAWNYVNQDAYISEFMKKKELQKIEGALANRLKTENTERLKELYCLPTGELVDELKSTVVLENGNGQNEEEPG